MSRNASSSVALVGLVLAVGVVRSLPREFWYAAGALLASLALALVAFVWKVVSVERKKQKAAAEAAITATRQRAEKQAEEAAALRLRREQQAEDRRREKERQNALGPFCFHCGKLTAPIYQYRRIDGGPDRRYHDNPMLCNRCFSSYNPRGTASPPERPAN